jgi:hypothetical protein
MSVDTEPNTTSRRDVLKKAAVAGAVAWTAPVVMSSRAFAGAIYVGPGEGCCDPVTGKGTVNKVTYTYSAAAPNAGNACNFGPGSAVTYNTLKNTSGVPLTGTLKSVVVTSGGSVGSIVYNGPNDIAEFVITKSSNDVVISLTDSNNNVQGFTVHLSCSTPLCIGDRHASLIVKALDVTPGNNSGTTYAWRLNDMGQLKCIEATTTTTTTTTVPGMGMSGM